MLLVSLTMLVAAVAVIVLLVADQVEEKATVRASLRQIGEAEVDNVRDRELLHPLRQRAVVPVLRGLSSLGGRFTPRGYVEQAKRKLVLAGRPAAEQLDRFLALRVLTITAAPVVLILGYLYLPLGAGLLRLIAVLLLPTFLVLGPDAILNRRVAERQHEILTRLPDVLDLLVISVEAGLGFEQALDRTVASVPGALSDEFARMLNEVRAGASRADAMRALDDRTGVTEVRSFVLAIIQADTFGVSIGRVLRAQADEMRIKRRQLAQEEAQKAPVKMLIPMVFCIFPSLFVVVLGPAILNIYDTFVS